jgi:hypothetical protein
MCCVAAVSCSHTPREQAARAPASPGALAVLAPATTTQGWTFHGADGRILSTTHYRLFTTVSDRVLLDRVPAFLESALLRYASAIAYLPEPAEPLDTFLFAERWQWERFTQQFMGDQAGTYLQIPRGGYAATGTGVFYDIGLHDTLAIAAHEGWHQYTQRVFAQGLPVWLEEGVACWMEGFRAEGVGPVRFLPWANVERFDQLRKAAGAGELIALRDVLDATPEDLLWKGDDAALTYYAQVWALVHFLESGEGGKYRPGLQALLMDSARGHARERITERQGAAAARRAMFSRTGAAAFRTYIADDVGQAGREYESFVRRVVGTGSKDRIVQGLEP